MKHNKKSSPTLNVKLLKYFSIFSIGLLVLLWFFQIVLLDDFYRIIRTRQVNKAGETLEEVVDEHSYADIRLRNVDIRLDENISCIIFNLDGNDYVIGNERNAQAVLGNNFGRIITELVKAKGEAKHKTLYITRSDERNIFGGFDTTISETSSEHARAIAYLTTTQDPLENNILIVTIGEIVPVDSTVTTLRTQLLIVTVIMAVISIILSLIASRRIAAPIADINERAKIMATGNYDIVFDGKGYYEIEELSDTLNETAIQLKQADEITKELIANVSHDLRTPLTMISGYGEIIRDLPGENTPENVQVIIDEANRLTSLVNNLLDISKLQAGNVTLNCMEINANELLLKVANTYQKMMESNGYTFELNLPSKEYYIYADSMRIEQCLYNLINNAITHIGDDKKVIVNCFKEGNDLVIQIIDHGEGIPEENLDRIWDRYFRGDDKHHLRAEKGSGLGLSIVKTILEMHNVQYGVESKVNEGSCFWFKLPISSEEQE